MSRLGSVLRILVATLSAGLVTGLTAMPASAHGDGRGQHGSGSFPAVVMLPSGFQPEGIAISKRTAYVGSLADGDIYAADLRTGRGKVISQGPGTPSAGLKVDARGRLFVAGASGGDARVVDTRTGAVLASYTFSTGPSFINDVVLTSRMAWFTDSVNAVLYGLPLGRHGALPARDAVVRLPLTGDYANGSGFNLNGIEAIGNGRALLAVQSNTGLLFRIDPRTGIATTVDLGGYLLTNGDGLLLRGRTLYAVQNQQNRIAVIRLKGNAASGTVQRTITSSAFDVPTTIAAFGRWLYLPNARFTTPPTPDTTYTAVRVRG